jgi:ectoine hydroxylase-related dioxygenase (phytanoyl-CoA dioxygenase family)
MATKFLTEQQLARFHAFGFLAFPGLLADRIADITDEFEAIWAANGGGHNGQAHDGTARSCSVQFIDQNVYLSTLLDDPRINGIAADILGDDFNYMGSDGNFYTGDTRWHSDGYGGRGGPLHIKIAFYLDSLTGENGALRVIPGSHRVGEPFADELQRSIRASDENWGLRGSEIPAIALATNPGDILIFNHDLKHAAFGGSQRRRMFTMNCCQRYPDDKLQHLRDYMGGGARFWIERAYGETMIDTASPARMTHLEQCLANDGHLAELSRKAREQMAEPARG